MKIGITIIALCLMSLLASCVSGSNKNDDALQVLIRTM